MDCSLLGSSVHGIFQARVLESGAIVFSTEKVYTWGKAARGSSLQGWEESLQVAHQVGSGGVGWRRGMEPKLEPSRTLTEPGKGGAGQRRAWEGLS